MVANSFFFDQNYYIRREKACKKEIQNMQHINIVSIKIFRSQSMEDYEWSKILSETSSSSAKELP